MVREWTVFTETGQEQVVGIATFKHTGSVPEGQTRYWFDSSLFKYGTLSERYKVTSGSLVVIEDITLVPAAKAKAYADKSLELLNYRKYLNNEAPFMYNGKKYVNDESNLQGVKVQVLDKSDSDPIPTFVGTPVAGTWRTYDREYVPYTNLSFRTGLADAYFVMRSHNFTNHGILQDQLTTIYEDPTQTAATIENFDITGGWSDASVVE